ncbi:MAG: hypothetical protein ABIH23_25485 [bacterium]
MNSPKFLLVLCAVTLVPLTAENGWAVDSPYLPGPGRYPRFEAKAAQPGLSYGKISDFPLPKTLLYSVDADELLADLDGWIERGYGGFFLRGVAGEWSADVWAVDGKPWTIGASDTTLQKVKQATAACAESGAEVFLSTAFSHPFEWFNDVAWRHIEHSFRQMAIFARDSGCTGIALDIEYINQQYHFSWEGYTYTDYSRRDLVETIRKRMKRVAEAMYDEFPDMVLLTLPEGSLSLGSVIQTAWIEEAARRNAPGGVHLCTEFTYRRPNIRFMFGHAWLNNYIFDHLLSEKGKSYWRKNCSIAAGLWPFGVDPDDYHGKEPTVDEFRQAFAASLMMGRRYNWIYSHNRRLLLLGREGDRSGVNGDPQDFVRVIAERAVVTDTKYVRTAEALRGMELRDYAEDLGLTIVPTFAGPREEIEVGLMPVKLYEPAPVAGLKQKLWDVAWRIQNGEDIDFHSTFGTQTTWMLIGPFDNTEGKGYAEVYPPEKEINPAAKYETTEGELTWRRYDAPPYQSSVDLTRVMQPAENVCAYALCYVHSPVEQDAEIRIGANDTWKIWVGGELIREYPYDGRVILDREIMPVKLRTGATPILLKVCNNKKDWGFIFRITGTAGEPSKDLRLGLTP